MTVIFSSKSNFKCLLCARYLLGFVLVFCLNAWAAVTKCHKLGALNNRHLAGPKAGKAKIKVLADWVPGENWLPGL